MNIYLQKLDRNKIKVDQDVRLWIVQNNISVSVNGHGHPKYWCRDSKKTILLSRKIMGFPEGLDVDHINGDPSDNRRKNLQSISSRSNLIKSKIPKNNTSGVKGVWWDKSKGRWEAFFYISVKKKVRKRFDKKSEAIKWRKSMEERDRRKEGYKVSTLVT